MITIRKANDRGRTATGWLDSRHSFSFGGYHDPRFQGFRDLLVINEDRVQPGQGFLPHGHRDMEIISYVLEGELEHKDSMGNGSIIRPGDVQRMSAGTGVRHSELNPSQTTPVHFLQIWLRPERDALKPGYEQKSFPAETRAGRLKLVASGDGAEGSIIVHQNARIYTTTLQAGQSVTHTLAQDRHAWVQVVRGTLELSGVSLQAGDGAALSGTTTIELRASEAAEALVFDLA